MGLDQPFFDDKNRAFWILQSIGWSGYFFLRSLSGFANSMGWMWLVHTLAADGHRLFAHACCWPRCSGVSSGCGRSGRSILSLGAVVFASIAFSVIETWSYATFLKPDLKPIGVEYLGAILLNFPCSRPGPRSTTESTTSCCWRTRSISASGWRSRRPARSWQCFATS